MSICLRKGQPLPNVKVNPNTFGSQFYPTYDGCFGKKFLSRSYRDRFELGALNKLTLKIKKLELIIRRDILSTV